jgi:hypothetical protein
MAPETPVQVLDIKSVQAAVQSFLKDQTGWRAEYRDLVWSHRLVSVKLSLLAGKLTTFGELALEVQMILAEATDAYVRELTATDLAQVICAPVA